MSQPNETTRMSGQKSFYTIFELTSTSSKLSPVIDLQEIVYSVLQTD